MACCSTVSCRWRYITDISLVQLLLSSGPNYLPADTQNLCVTSGGVHNSVCNIMYFLILAPIILPFPVDINHVKCYINIVDINTNYVFLSEYPN